MMEIKSKWSNQLESSLVVMGMAVQAIDFSILPYNFYRHGGAFFWIPFLVMQLFVSAPLIFIFLSLGQYCSSGILTCWKFAKVCSGIGGSMFLLGFLTTLVYQMVPAWSLVYLFNIDYLASLDCTGYSNYLSFNISSNDCHKAMESFFHQTVGSSNNINELGSVIWQPTIGLLALYVLAFVVLVFGVTVFGKLAYVTATLPFLCMLILMVRAITLEGSYNGINYVMKATLSRIGELDTWYRAFLFAIYKSSLGFGIYVTIGSYNKFHNDTFRDTLLMVIYGVAYSTICVYTSCAFSGYYLNLTHGPLYSFPLYGFRIFYLQMIVVFRSIPVSGLWVALLHINIICNYFHLLICSVLTMVSSVTDLFPILRRRIWCMSVLGTISILLILLALPLLTQAGSKVFGYSDEVFSFNAQYLIILICSCLSIGYFYGVLTFCDDIKIMVNHRILRFLPWIIVKVFLIPTICFITPWFIAVFGSFLIKEYGFHMKDYWKSEWQTQVAYFFMAFVILPIPLVALIILIIQMKKSKGRFIERLSTLFTPTRDWGPVEIKHRQEVEEHLKKYGFVVNPWEENDTTVLCDLSEVNNAFNQESNFE